MVVLGDRGAGTTSLLDRLRTGLFPDSPKPTVGADGFTYHADVPGLRCRLRVWDCACVASGAPANLQQVVMRLLQRAHIVLIAYEVPSQATLATIKFVQDSLAAAGSAALVAGVVTKADKRRPRKQKVASLEEAMRGVQTFVTSAKTGYGIAYMVETVVGQCVLSRSWKPGMVAARQRLAWAQATAHYGLAPHVTHCVARCLHGGRTPWPVVGQASVDSAHAASAAGDFRYAMYNLSIASAIFRSEPSLASATEQALLQTVAISIPRAELVLESSTGGQHTAYVIRCLVRTGEGETAADRVEQFVRRRYSEFVALHEALSARLPGTTLAPMPPKRKRTVLFRVQYCRVTCFCAADAQGCFTATT